MFFYFRKESQPGPLNPGYGAKRKARSQSWEEQRADRSTIINMQMAFFWESKGYYPIDIQLGR